MKLILPFLYHLLFFYLEPSWILFHLPLLHLFSYGLIRIENSAAALEWLLLHVPERDLPLQYKPEIIDMKTHVHDTTALAREYTIRRILDYGNIL